MSEAMGLLRFSTAGSVDDGKSTLIGRLLYDTKQIFADQLEHVVETSKRRGFDRTELALLTDGLRAEREQGITIDVAYRYFATPVRKFIIADTPGHVQYTRNMVTGASTADLAVVLVDARHGLVEQSRRHAFIASLLRIPHITLAVNKMDLAGWDAARFASIVEEFKSYAASIGVGSLGDGTASISAIPLSALHGDNVVARSANTPWYDGPTLLEHLEQVPVASAYEKVKGRFPVQWVIRPQSDAFHDYRGYAGAVAGGVFRPNDEVVVYPAEHRTKITHVETWDGPMSEAFAPLSVVLRLEHDIDISRGDLIASPEDPPIVGQELIADVCWMHQRPLALRGMYLLKHTTRTVRAMVTGIEYRLDVNSLAKDPNANKLELNDLGRVYLKTTAPVCYDDYERNRTMGAGILIEESSNLTVGAVMLRAPHPTGT